MSNFSITGRIYNGSATEQKGNNFTVRQFTLEVTENTNSGTSYTNHIGFQLANDKCALLDSFVIGQTVTVHFNLRGTLWNDKTITNLQAWKMEAAQGQQPAQPQYQQQQPQQLKPQQQQWQQPQQPQQPAQFQSQQPAYAPAAPTAQPQQQQWPQQQPAFGNAQPAPQPAFGNPQPQQQPQFYPQQSQSGDLPF